MSINLPLAELFRRDLTRLTQQLEAFPTEESLWQTLPGITNSAGQEVPWLELYNPSTNFVSLSGLYLANTYTNLVQWPFPAAAVI